TLKDGTATLKDGAATLRTGAENAADGSSRLAAGAESLSAGAQNAANGAAAVHGGASKLASGASAVAGGVDTVVSKMGDVRTNLDAMRTAVKVKSDGTGLRNGSAGNLQIVNGLADGSANLNALVTGVSPAVEALLDIDHTTLGSRALTPEEIGVIATAIGTLKSTPGGGPANAWQTLQGGISGMNATLNVGTAATNSIPAKSIAE